MENIIEIWNIIKKPTITIFYFTIRLILNTINYFLSTSLILISIIPIFFIFINLNIDFLLILVFKFYSLINPTFKTMYESGHLTMSLPEMMKMFTVLTLVFMLVSILIKALLKKVLKFKIVLSYRKKLLYSFIFITFVYIILIIIGGFSNNGGKNLIPLFTISYFIYLILYFIYFWLQTLLSKLKKIFYKQTIDGLF